MDYAIYDVDGRFYLYGVTPVAGGILANALAAAMPRRWPTWRRSMGAVVVTVLLSVPFHWWAIREGYVGGGYKLPEGFDPARADMAELERGAWSANQTLRGTSVNEMVRRGSKSTDALLRLIGEARKRYGTEYLDDRQVLKAVDALAESGELRVVPVLKEMAGCPASGGAFVAVVSEWNRRRAVNMLRIQYGFKDPCLP